MKIELSKTNPNFAKIYFVLQAKAKDSSRFAIESVLIEKGDIVATDGRVLYCLNIKHSFEPGLYEVIKCTKSSIILLTNDNAGKFPTWRDIIPEHETYFTVQGGYGLAYFISQVLGCLGKKNVTVNYEYLKPLADLDMTWDVYFGNPDRPVYFVSDNLSAIIMPVISKLAEAEFKTKPKPTTKKKPKHKK